MSSTALETSYISVRLAQTPGEITDAQRVRYRVFFDEYGAKPSPTAANLQLDSDEYDEHADHLIVIDGSDGQDKIVGTYRLLQRAAADKCGQFYSSNEFNISPILDSGLSLLELGRSCVLPEYRTKKVLQMLWQGIADYITERDIDLMFGCASLHTTNINEIAEPLSYMHHFHPSPENLRPFALDDRYIDMNIIPKDEIDAKRVFVSLPPIIKGYLRVGGTIGNGAVLDPDFNTTDVCVIVQTQLLTDRYRKHYERKMQKTMPGETAAIAGKA